ncbi:predicted protein [Plenodomus lingam JN3]|uniref:Predicted protein n=1 Tax=Leptosphaeria maculans (strain JN3 / isolate v23.1.3 / race Av1-4-5-6-7-8) TaxID=985895 RepID=E4ZNH3_LEPMJ|nr:predicted protein [Plenodomus lingam JN3]CBX93032.1 predicted protein [Plenodomus lingam JN3]
MGDGREGGGVVIFKCKTYRKGHCCWRASMGTPSCEASKRVAGQHQLMSGAITPIYILGTPSTVHDSTFSRAPPSMRRSASGTRRDVCSVCGNGRARARPFGTVPASSQHSGCSAVGSTIILFHLALPYPAVERSATHEEPPLQPACLPIRQPATASPLGAEKPWSLHMHAAEHRCLGCAAAYNAYMVQTCVHPHPLFDLLDNIYSTGAVHGLRSRKQACMSTRPHQPAYSTGTRYCLHGCFSVASAAPVQQHAPLPPAAEIIGLHCGTRDGLSSCHLPLNTPALVLAKTA